MFTNQRVTSTALLQQWKQTAFYQEYIKTLLLWNVKAYIQMFPLQKFTATSRWVNQLKRGNLTQPFVFVINYNLKIESIFGTRKQGSKKKKIYKIY